VDGGGISVLNKIFRTSAARVAHRVTLLHEMGTPEEELNELQRKYMLLGAWPPSAAGLAQTDACSQRATGERTMRRRSGRSSRTAKRSRR